MFIEVASADLFLSHPIQDSADTDFPSRIPTVDEPSGNGVFPLAMGREGAGTEPSLHLIPIGTGADNAVMTGMRVIGWEFLPGVQGAGSTLKKGLWIPTILAQFAGVFGNITGVSGAKLATTYFFMDTITLVTGNANISNEIISPTGDVIGRIQMATRGCRKIEINFDLGANATGLNCLVRKG